MSSFSEIWDNEVKKLAVDCIDKDVIDLAYRESLTKEEKERLKEYQRKYIDLRAMLEISSMCFYVEHNLADDRQWMAKGITEGVYLVLNDDDYWANVFRGDTQSEYPQKLLKLKEGLHKLNNSFSYTK